MEWFFRKKKNWALVKLCQINEGPQIQKFSLKYCLLTGRGASENFDCYPKMGNIFKNILKNGPETKFVL